jgi:ubiquinone/menaquinone biosynthesis C-methylase UbiE
VVAVKRDEKILDAACGTGIYSFEFASKGADVIGVDFSEAMLKSARLKYPKLNFKYADLTKKLPFQNNKFDKINCAQALKHIKNLIPPLKEFFRILRKGGSFVFSVTHPEMDWEGYETKIKPAFVLSGQSEIYHHRFADYFDAIDKAGFEINRIVQLAVSEKVRHLLTARSYRTVKGRYEIVIFRLGKS